MKALPKDKQTLLAVLRRYHFVFFIVITVLILSVAILLLYGFVIKASGEGSTPINTTSLNFDQETIDQIQRLKTAEEPGNQLDLSGRRINPFSE